RSRSPTSRRWSGAYTCDRGSRERSGAEWRARSPWGQGGVSGPERGGGAAHHGCRAGGAPPERSGGGGNGLHVFDMDGTLLGGTTASLQIAAALGGVEALTALEHSFGRGELDTRGFALAIRELWAALTPAHVVAAFDGSPWLSGIREVCADI